MSTQSVAQVSRSLLVRSCGVALLFLIALLALLDMQSSEAEDMPDESSSAGLVISSVPDLYDFVDSEHPCPTSIDCLAIDLPAPPPLDALRHALSLANNITDLVLVLPPQTSEPILDGLQFPALQLFKTNLPHRFLTAFLTYNATVTDLSLGPCGVRPSEPCPLGGINLAHVLDGEFPDDCVVCNVHSGLRSLTVQGQKAEFNAPAILRAIRSPLKSLSHLTIDFFADDYDILDSVIRAAPMVRKLRLLEKPHPMRRGRARRAWNDAASWSRSLVRLRNLDELALRTSWALVEITGDVNDEKKALMAWVTTTSRAKNSEVRTSGHPALSFIRLWYRANDPVNGVLTGWSRATGTWRNITRTIGPQMDAFF